MVCSDRKTACTVRVLCRTLGTLYQLEQDNKATSEAPVATAAAAAESGGKEEKSDAWKAYEAGYKELSKWADVTAADYVTTYSVFEAAAGRPANAIKVRALVCVDCVALHSAVELFPGRF
jgi:hypothetical protein